MSVSGYALLAIGFYAVSRAVVRYQMRRASRPSNIESPFVVKVDRSNHREEKH